SVFGSLSVGPLASMALAQTPAPPAPAPQQDFSKVEIKTHQVASNFYYLEGQGGNVGVLIGDDGVLMIDDQFAPLTEKIMAAVKALSQKPVRMLVNTHVHGDHTDGDGYIHFPKADVIHVGDVFRTVGYPGVDGANGGTVKGTIQALDMIVKMAGPNTKIV